jgi:hypothetical protein
MIDRQLLDRPALDETLDEFTGRVTRPRGFTRCGASIVGANAGPDEAGAFGPGRRAPA